MVTDLLDLLYYNNAVSTTRIINPDHSTLIFTGRDKVIDAQRVVKAQKADFSVMD